MPFQCRYYENEYPEENEIVVVNVKSIQKMGSYVVLLEYKEKCGMILHTELSRRRIRSINKLIHVDRDETVAVVRVDSDKGYIDLSKRRVTPEDSIKCLDRYAKAKTINQILRHVSEVLHFKSQEELEDLYTKTAWAFDKKFDKKGLGAYEAFKLAVNNPSILDDCGLDEKVKDTLYKNICHRLMPQASKMRADFEVSCFTCEGINAIKKALNIGLEFADLASDSNKVRINLIAPPLFVMTTQSMNVTSALKNMEDTLNEIKKAIIELGGNFVMKQAPRIVSDTDESDLAKQFADLEEANKEVSGDDDSDEEESSDEGSDNGNEK